MTNETVIEKIRKLLAVASNEGATESEAASALEMANRLMLKYNIDRSIIEDSDEQSEPMALGDKLDTGGHQWARMLAIKVGQMYGTVPFKVSKRHFHYTGRPDTIEVSHMTWEWVVAQINVFYKQALPPGMPKHERAAFRREFKAGCALRVCARIEEIVARSMTEEGAAAVGSTALVVIEVKQKQINDANEFLDKKFKAKTTTTRLRVRTSEASLLGHAAGDRVKLNDQVKG